MAQAASKSCEICDSSIGRYYCQQCDQMFCENCRSAHLRIKTTKNHTFLRGRNINPEEKPFCSKHDEPLIFHCKDCDTAVCHRCAVQDHNRHNMSGIKESVLKLKEQLTKRVDSMCTDLNTDINQIQKGNIDFQSDVKTAIDSITEDAKQMKDWIDTNAEELIKSVNEIEEKNRRILSTANDEFNDSFSKINKVKKTIADTSRMSDVAMLPKIKQLQTEIDRLVTKKVSSMPTIKYHRKKLSKNDAGNLFGKLISSEAAILENKVTDTKNSKQHINTRVYDDTDAYYDEYDRQQEEEEHDRMMEQMEQYDQGYDDRDYEREEEERYYDDY